MCKFIGVLLLAKIGPVSGVAFSRYAGVSLCRDVCDHDDGEPGRLDTGELPANFAPKHHSEWEDEPHKSEYRGAAEAIISAIEQAAPEGRQEAGRIGDAVLDWMVKFDLLDAGNEYYASDVLAVLNDLTPSTRPSEQAVTKEMVNAAYNEGKSRSMTGMPNDFRAVVHAAIKAAMEAGRHD